MLKKQIRIINTWLNSGKKELPEEVRSYIKSIQLQVVYQRDINPADSLEKLADDYLYNHGVWRITEEVRCLSPLSINSVEDTANVFLLKEYYGQRIGTYYFFLTAFVKVRDHWKHIGNLDSEMNRLPRPDEVELSFVDEYGKIRKDKCQGTKEFYYEY